MARPTKYTPETVKRITDAIKLGATYELAAAYGGIDYQTFNRWMKSKREFCQVVKDAEGEAVTKWLAKIEKAASDGAWQAAAWKLERRYPHQYGRTVNEQHHTFKSREIAEKVAASLGLDPDEVLAEAERIVAGASA